MTMSISLTRFYMMAEHASLLKDHKLCDYLEQMDKRELKQIIKEEKPLYDETAQLDQAYSWKNILFKGGCVALGIGGSTGTVKYIYDHSEHAKPKFDKIGHNLRCYTSALDAKFPKGVNVEQYHACYESALRSYNESEKERIANSPKESAKWFIISAVITGGVVIGYELSSYYSQKGSLVRTYTNIINDDRYSRLQNKIREVEKRLLQTSDEIELRQLPIAKDYFEKKHLDMKLNLTNTVTVIHRYV